MKTSRRSQEYHRYYSKIVENELITNAIPDKIYKRLDEYSLVIVKDKSGIKMYRDVTEAFSPR